MKNIKYEVQTITIKGEIDDDEDSLKATVYEKIQFMIEEDSLKIWPVESEDEDEEDRV